MSDDGYALSEGDFSPSSVASLDSILRSQVYSPEVDSPLVRDDDATPRRGRRDAPGRPVTHARRLALEVQREFDALASEPRVPPWCRGGRGCPGAGEARCRPGMEAASRVGGL